MRIRHSTTAYTFYNIIYCACPGGDFLARIGGGGGVLMAIDPAAASVDGVVVVVDVVVVAVAVVVVVVPGRADPDRSLSTVQTPMFETSHNAAWARWIASGLPRSSRREASGTTVSVRSAISVLGGSVRSRMASCSSRRSSPTWSV